jgi:hypothetical protein
MEIEVLDSKSEGKSTCFLVKASLRTYLNSLPTDFDNFHIQRDRTNNVYLDRLIDTVIARRQIPTIVLVADKIDRTKGQAEGLKILDGLQRTLRLKAIADAVKIASIADLDAGRTTLLTKHSSELNAKSIDASTFLRVVEEIRKKGIDFLNDCFSQTQWFEIWSHLSEEEQVRKMLLLNAGHKPVKTRHQLELLFLGLLPKLEKSQKNGFIVIREKEKSSITFSKNRQVGEFHFAAVVASLVAFYLGKPVTTNAELISDLQNDESEASLRKGVESFSYKFAAHLTSFLVELDQLVEKKEGASGTQWLGREVILVGVFAALGDYARRQEISPEGAFGDLIKKLTASQLNLHDFENERNRQDLSRVNIGSVNKRAVFQATHDILNSVKPLSLAWSTYFRTE